MSPQVSSALASKLALWVETLWLFDTLEAETPIREIPLARGLNLIVSPPGAHNLGHGVGKTAFCQLLRFVLDDPLWSGGSPLADELRHSLRDGAVAARVHLGDEVWNVLKPWGHPRRYRASRSAGWRELAREGAENEFAAYQAALQALIERLPAQTLPGDGQHIQWHQLLAWCSRDQNARYRSYYQWRAEGAGFGLPARSPAVLVQLALGLLDDTATLVEIDATEHVLDATRQALQALRDEPARLLKHVRRQIENLLGAGSELPFARRDLLDAGSLIDLARQRCDGYAREIEQIEGERQQLTAQAAALIEERAPLKSRADLVANELAQIEAALAGNANELDRLRNEAGALRQRLPTWCDAGNRLLRDCDYVTTRVELSDIDRARGMKRHQESLDKLARERRGYEARLAQLREEMRPFDARLAELETRRKTLDARHVQTLRDARLLDTALGDHEHYEALASGREQSDEIAVLVRKEMEQRGQLDRLELKRTSEQDAARERRRAIQERINAIARQLPNFAWGVFNEMDSREKNRPFRMGPSHSTTYGVLEILAGDLACLLDSPSPGSRHPGFLLHDSPREAEMSEALFWALMAVPSAEPSPGFQYVVTTSTRVPKRFEPYVRLELSGNDDAGLLLKQKIGVDTPPLPE